MRTTARAQAAAEAAASTLPPGYPRVSDEVQVWDDDESAWYGGAVTEVNANFVVVEGSTTDSEDTVWTVEISTTSWHTRVKVLDTDCPEGRNHCWQRVTLLPNTRRIAISRRCPMDVRCDCLSPSILKRCSHQVRSSKKNLSARAFSSQA